MKPLAIADYLDHHGRGPTEPAREVSPFRPRSLRSLRDAEPQSDSAVARTPKIGIVGDPPAGERPQRALPARKPISSESSARQSRAAGEAVKTEDIAARLAEAHAQGREEGRAEALRRRAADLAAAQEQALAQQTEFRVNEYARLEGVIRSGLVEIEQNVGAAVTRILAPFLTERVVRHVVEELSKDIVRLVAGGSQGLIAIRGPERILKLLRQRIVDLPAEVEYIESDGVEAVVEAKATQIVTELRSWAELLASLDA